MNYWKHHLLPEKKFDVTEQEIVETISEPLTKDVLFDV